MSCDPIRDQLTAYILGDLDATAAAAVRAHLDACRDCQAIAQEIESTLGLVRDALAGSAAETRGGLSPERRQRALAALAETPAAKPETEASPWGWLTAGHPRLAIAAGLTLVVGMVWLLMPHAKKPKSDVVFDVSTVLSEEQLENLGAYHVAGERSAASAPAASAVPGSVSSAPDTPRMATEGGLTGSDERVYKLSESAARDERQFEEHGTFGGLSSELGLATAAKPASRSNREDDDARSVEDLGRMVQLAIDNGVTHSEENLSLSDSAFAPQPVALGAESALNGQVGGVYARTSTSRERGVAESGGGAGGGRDGADVAGLEAAPPPATPAPQEEPPASAPASVASPKPVIVSGVAKDETWAYQNGAGPQDRSDRRKEAGENFGEGKAVVTRQLDELRRAGEDVKSLEADVDGDRLSAPAGQLVSNDKLRVQDSLASANGDSNGSAQPRPPAKGPLASSSRGDNVAESATAGQPSLPPGDSETAVSNLECEAPAESIARGRLEATKKKVDQSGKKEREMPLRESSVSAPSYRAYGVNNTVEAASAPLSTFAIDVDTASYTQARQFMSRGLLPPPEAVRTEEFINFFDYDYPAPEGAAFRIHAELAPSRFGHGEHLLKLGIKGRRLGREEQRPAALTLLVDTSGSMETPDRLGLLQLSLQKLVEGLGDEDVVSLVQYGDHARVILDQVSAKEKVRILLAVNALQCTGSTNLEEGMTTAYAQAAAQFVPGGENRVLVLTDGMANLGADTAEPILAKVADQRRQGIRCSIFGFGQGAYNDAMLESLADKGDGVYAFIDSEAEAQRLFVDDLAATLNTIASDVKIQVAFNPAVARRYRQLGYENRQLTADQFRDDTVDAGEVGSGQSVTALYELSLAAADPDAIAATVRVRYRDLESGTIKEIALPVRAGEARASFDAASTWFRLAAGVAEFAEQLRGSPYAAGSSPAEVADVLRPVALDLNLDTRVQNLLRLVEQAGGMSRAPDTTQP